MDEASVYTLIKNLDERTERIEQYLPTLSTREETHAAIRAAVAPLATREEMHAAIRAAVAPLATREEMHAAIQAAIAPLATRAELQAAIAPLATRAELQAEGEASRQFTRVLVEDLRDDNRIILEHLVALSARVDQLAHR
jgi:hypothetical protein